MKILFFGDSITDAGRARDRDGHIAGLGYGYVNQCAAALAFEDPAKYQIVNRGISGHRVVDLYARVKADVWLEQPDVLSILIGVNDVWHEIASENGVELDRWERIYRTMLQETKERLPNIKIMILEPFILEGSATDGEERWQKFQAVKEYAKVAKKLAEEFGATFVPLQEKFDEAKARFGGDYYTFDGVHPLAAGAKMIATEWLKAFRKIEK
jgi:lysophospholipase L1-like esterase